MWRLPGRCFLEVAALEWRMPDQPSSVCAGGPAVCSEPALPWPVPRPDRHRPRAALPQIAADDSGKPIGDLAVSDVIHKVYIKVQQGGLVGVWGCRGCRCALTRPTPGLPLLPRCCPPWRRPQPRPRRAFPRRTLPAPACLPWLPILERWRKRAPRRQQPPPCCWLKPPRSPSPPVSPHFWLMQLLFFARAGCRRTRRARRRPRPLQ